MSPFHRGEPDRRNDLLGSVTARHLAAACICGGILALVETVEVFAGGYGATLSFGQGVVFYLLSAGLLSFAAGLVGAGAMLLMLVRPTQGQQLATPRFGGGVEAVVAVTCCNVLLTLITLVPLYSARQIGMGSWQLLATLPVAAGVGLGVGRTVRWCPKLLSFAVWANVGLGYLVLSRWLYMFSRYGSLSYVHGLGLVLFLLLLFWIAFDHLRRPTRAEGRAGALLLVGLASAYVIALSTTTRIVDQIGHSLPVTLQERTTLTHRVLSWTALVRSAEPRRLQSWSTACPDLQRKREPASPDGSMNPSPVRGVLLVLVDSLRADRLEAVREGRPLTPSLREQAKRSTVFSNAFATYPGTLHSVRAMASGRYFEPAERDGTHGKATRLGTLLEAHGVTAEAIIAHANLRTALGDVKVDDRFSEENQPEGKNARTSLNVARATLESLVRLGGQENGFLLISHFYDAHAHYVGNELVDFGGAEEELYDAEVYYADHWIGWLLTEAESAGLLEGVAVVVVSDHGDEFWDHRYARHQFRLYDESIRQVLMVRMPEQRVGRRVRMPVSGADMLPTLLQLLRIPHDGPFDGVSLVPWLTSDAPEPPHRSVFMRAAGSSKLGVVSGGRKLIVNQDFGALELYDLDADPHERINLADEPPAKARLMFCELRDWAAAEGVWSSTGSEG